ncbi:hypothetical protein SDC9_191050 [bioreactor metagenome]|uniref:Uncharacterized protein n=1 Tax=bioreactor metagenome TaxID=1076179 RepID=A0A645HX92_9ZZZZ
MQKFTVGAVEPSVESLLGQWLIWDESEFSSNITSVFDLTKVENGRAKDEAGSAQCWFETTAQGTVRCQGPRGEYRFTPAYGNGSSIGRVMNDEQDMIIVWRTKDRHGVVGGAK